MKTRTQQNKMVHRVLMLAALLAGAVMVPALRAQPAAPKVDNRFLLIFDISSDMKKRLPAVQKTLETTLTTSANGQLHLGDSVGVWTFDQELHTGQFPLQYWRPDNAPMIVSNISKFVSQQHYSKKTGFDALQPLLNRVVLVSERLTVLIFCDGKGEIYGTPYDAGINQIFQQRQDERQKAQLPIVIALRSQLGQYVGCTVSFPPQPVNLPAFPPLPAAAFAPPVAKESAPPGPPRSSVPSLIVIGKPPTNRVPPAPKPPPTNPPAVTVTSTPAPAVASEVKPPAVVPLVKTDTVPLMQTSAVPAQPSVTSAPVRPTQAATPPPESPWINGKSALAIGVAFLAGGLAVFLLRRAR